MNRDELIKIAEEVGLSHFYDSESQCTGITDDHLVTKEKDRNDDRLVEILMPLTHKVIEYERKRCLDILLKLHRNSLHIHSYYFHAAVEIDKAIANLIIKTDGQEKYRC
jgi:RecJ-like exonuclease